MKVRHIFAVSLIVAGAAFNQMEPTVLGFFSWVGLGTVAALVWSNNGRQWL